ncbi:DUF2726 domain-containing protein [Pontibacter sp. 13R65]|uniref:DUF2726 domain-containing protein n=1 Tax=Pontibacter sp. 13R65 TaxID=3127458 RepID=UPI00301BE738
MAAKVKYDREEVLQHIFKQEWQHLIELLKSNEVVEGISNDNIASTIVSENFINELLNGSSFVEDSDYPFFLSQFYNLHSGQKFKFSLDDKDYVRLVIKLVSVYSVQGDLDAAYGYAQLLPNEETCKKIILKFEKHITHETEHAQSDNIILRENKEISTVDLTISLFKSSQELTFFQAVRTAYQTYMVYPNVALSAVISWDAIADSLTKTERDYFFKALIDCVVIDQALNYKPIKFIELDSVYHDSKDQQHKDLMKDSIIAKAGHKLFRIRPRYQAASELEFLQLIREKITTTN